MKSISWNVNSIRTRQRAKLDWLTQQNADIIFLQEIKCANAEFPVDEFGDLGYDVVLNGRGGKNGVAIAVRDLATQIDASDEDGRLVSCCAFDLRLVCAYAPARAENRLTWLTRLVAFIAQHKEQTVLLAGDLNVCLSELDTTATLEVDSQSVDERAVLRSTGLVDAFRAKCLSERVYTWERSPLGLRLDYQLHSPTLAAFDAGVEQACLLSDHRPTRLGW